MFVKIFLETEKWTYLSLRELDRDRDLLRDERDRDRLREDLERERERDLDDLLDFS